MRLSKQIVIAATIAVTALIGLQTAKATTIMKQSFSELVEQSDGILAGTVSNIVYERGEGGRIYTFVILDKLEVIRGLYSGGTFSMRFEGGELNGEIQKVVGSPDFRAGERVIVMVDGNGEKIVPVAGWNQGLFRVHRDRRNGTSFVSDSVGNRIYGIQEDEVIKENRAQTRVHILDNQHGRTVQSEMKSVRFGKTTGGRNVNASDDITANTDSPPVLKLQSNVGSVMTVNAFKGLIERENSTMAVVSFDEMVSVEPGNTPPSRETPDAQLRTN